MDVESKVICRTNADDREDQHGNQKTLVTAFQNSVPKARGLQSPTEGGPPIEVWSFYWPRTSTPIRQQLGPRHLVRFLSFAKDTHPSDTHPSYCPTRHPNKT